MRKQIPAGSVSAIKTFVSFPLGESLFPGLFLSVEVVFNRFFCALFALCVVVDEDLGFVLFLVLLSCCKSVKLHLHLLLFYLSRLKRVYFLLSRPLMHFEFTELASHWTVHDIFGVFVTDAHDSSHCIWVFLEEMLVHHHPDHFFLLQEILHHLVVHFVFLVVNG